MKYAILCKPTPAELAQEVQNALNQGWKLEGGVGFSYVNKPLYFQAMTIQEAH